MKSDSKGEGKISWKTHGQKDYTDDTSEKFDVEHDGQWHSYTVPMDLAGVLGTLAIQPSSGEGLIELRNIVLTTKDGYYIRDWPINQ